MTDVNDAEALEDTGERCIPGESSPIIFCEHVHRYLFACAFVTDRDVLDVGSGEGYGCALLARTARSVTGIDIDAPTVQHSSSHYQAGNLRFVQGSAADLSPCADHSVDVVTCYETLEHITEHAGLMTNIKRVLRPGGLLLLSSPDRDVYTTATGRHNPFHVLELNLLELRDLLAGYFAHQVVYRQTMSVGSYMSLVGIDSDLSTSTMDFVGSRVGDGWRHDPTDDREYLFAIASDAEPPALPAASHLHDSDFEFRRIAEEWERQMNRWQRDAGAWEQATHDRERDVEKLLREMESLQQRAHELEQSEYWQQRAEESSGELDLLRVEYDALREDFDAVRATRAYHAIAKLWRLQKTAQAIVAGRASGRRDRPSAPH